MLEGTWIVTLVAGSLRSLSLDFRSINFGGPRTIPKQKKIGVKVHRSVKIRMQAEGLFKDKKYAPAAKLDVEPEWVS
jgi:hypothetical protein